MSELSDDRSNATSIADSSSEDSTGVRMAGVIHKVMTKLEARVVPYKLYKLHSQGLEEEKKQLVDQLAQMQAASIEQGTLPPSSNPPLAPQTAGSYRSLPTPMLGKNLLTTKESAALSSQSPCSRRRRASAWRC